MKYTCPKCGKSLDLSAEALIASQYKTVCPQCLTQLEIVGDYAYVPLDDGSLELRRDPEPSQEQPSQPSSRQPQRSQPEAVAQPVQAPPPLPSQLGGDGRDPLYDEAVRYLSQCSAITPMMLRDYFNIPIERAQDIIAQLERAGCIGPYRGGAPRQILIDHHEGLPSPLNYNSRFDPNAREPQQGDQPQGGKMVNVNCGSCLIWLVLIALLVFLLVK